VSEWRLRVAQRVNVQRRVTIVRNAIRYRYVESAVSYGQVLWQWCAEGVARRRKKARVVEAREALYSGTLVRPGKVAGMAKAVLAGG